MSAYQALFDQLYIEDVVLSVNQRLASFLEQQFCQRKGGICDEKFMALNSWVAQIWQRLQVQGTALPMLMSALQERVCWEQVLAHESRVLLSRSAAAYQAQNAWQLLQEWQLSLTDLPAPYSEDVAAFKAWAELFSQQCEANRCLSQSEQLGYLMNLPAETLKPLLPPRLWLLGFRELSPQLQAFIGHCQALGSQVLEFKLEPRSCDVKVLATESRDAQLRVALDWAYQRLAAAPLETLAVVVPDLHTSRQEVLRLLNETGLLYPHIQPRVVVSGGEPLAAYPLVHDALKILSLPWLQTYDELSLVLRSPFIRGAEIERAQRDERDIHLRSTVSQFIKFTELYTLPGWDSCPLLWEALERYRSYSPPKSAPLRFWARYFLNLLEAFGWPGKAVLSSEEHQIVSGWQSSLDEWLQFAVIQEYYSLEQALALLRMTLDNAPFQPQSPAKPQLQILGLLEVGGLHFDAIWVSGLNEDNWPPKAKPTPFLPLAMQRRLLMPHASSERELQFARDFLAALQCQTSSLNLSYPMWEGDIHFNKSPLLAVWPETFMPTPCGFAEALRAKAQVLEVLSDAMGPRVSEREFAEIKGGYTLFQQQAVCPFQAYAAQRLKVEAFPEFTAYMDAKLRGTILHSILEQVWQTLGSQSRLLALADSDLQHLVNAIIHKVLRRYQIESAHLLTPALAALEAQRLEKLVLEWLELEKSRAEFRVLAQEQTVLSQVAGIPLKMRVDRIDQLADGSKVVLDYKTGQTAYQYWFDDRPSEVQLPLYALITQAEALAYAKIRVGEMAFVGVAKKAEMLPQVKSLAENKFAAFETWEALTAHWQSVFARLADEFLQGQAIVAPKSLIEGCQRCRFQPLCRIHEAVGVLDSD